MELFTRKDFKVFDIPGFEERMQALAAGIRPKLTAIGNELAPEISAMVDRPLFVHVARHARRTVNPPDDTWAALGADKRGYKKDVHFKVAISRHAVRLLFEVGPEYYDKGEWALEWGREIGLIRDSLARAERLAWFKDEHDEEPAALLSEMPQADLTDLGHELTRRRDGQLVVGRRIDEKEILKMSPAAFKRTAMAAFRPLAPLFALHDVRVAGSSSK